MEGPGKVIPCNRCNRALTVYCSCSKNIVPTPGGDQSIQGHHLGLRDRLRSFSAHMINKMQGNASPSLNFIPQSPSFQRSTKRAVLCGVSYRKWKYKLKASVNDVKSMRDLLISKFGYPQEQIRVLTEEEPEQQFHPYRANIEDSLKWLVDDCQPGDSLVFFYSGHGLQQIDFQNDELDGFDETICPTDFLKAGMILDNYLNETLVRPLKKDVKLHAIIDACHSGTVLDLPHVYDRKLKKWKDNCPPNRANKRTDGGLAISICACEDYQKAADTTAFTGKMTGTMTHILIDVLKKLPGPSYGDLFDLMEETIDEVNNQIGCPVNAKIFRTVINGRLTQTPLLSSSQQFHPYKTHLLL